MSEAIEEIKGKKNRREKALEAWAATIYADRAKPGPSSGQGLKAEGTGGSSFRKELLKKPDQVRQIKPEPKVEVVRDTVESVNSSPEARVQDQMESARKLVAGRPKATPPTPAPAQNPATQAVENAQAQEQTSEVVEAAQQEAIQEVTPDEVQTVSVQAGGGTPATKKAQKTQKAEQSQAAETEEESEVDDSVRQLIKPGNSPKAKAYVRVSDLPMATSGGGQGLEDFLLAL